MANGLGQRITGYTVWVAQTDFTGSGDPYYDYTRAITITLELGDTVYIYFPEVRPDDWLQNPEPRVYNLYMTADQYDDVYHVLQTETPAYCTILALDGLQVGSVYTEFPQRIYPVPPVPPIPPVFPEQSLEARITRGRSQDAGSRRPPEAN